MERNPAGQSPEERQGGGPEPDAEPKTEKRQNRMGSSRRKREKQKKQPGHPKALAKAQCGKPGPMAEAMAHLQELQQEEEAEDAY